VTQYFPNVAGGHRSGQLMVLRTTPKAGGGFDAAIVGSYVFPDIHDPVSGALLTLSPREVESDPSSIAGDERFAIGFDMAAPDGNPLPTPIQEFTYNSATGTIQPVSAPILPGDLSVAKDAAGIARYKSFGDFHYDHDGNLWVG